MSPKFFYDSGNVGFSFGEYLVYAHWMTLTVAAVVIVLALWAWRAFT